MSIICTSLTVQTQPSPRFHVKSVVIFRELLNRLLTLFGSFRFLCILKNQRSVGYLKPGVKDLTPVQYRPLHGFHRYLDFGAVAANVTGNVGVNA